MMKNSDHADVYGGSLPETNRKNLPWDRMAGGWRRGIMESGVKGVRQVIA